MSPSPSPLLREHATILLAAPRAQQKLRISDKKLPETINTVLHICGELQEENWWNLVGEVLQKSDLNATWQNKSACLRTADCREHSLKINLLGIELVVPSATKYS